MPEAAAAAVPAVVTADAAAPETTEAPEVQADTKVEVKPTPRTFKAKVNGREIELGEDEVIQSGLSAAQIRRAATEQFEQAKQARAEVEQLRRAFAEDPVHALEQLAGSAPKLREVVEQFLVRRLQEEQLDPRERARLDAERARDEAVRRAQDLEKTALSQRQAAQEREIATQLDKEFGDALQSGQLPKTTDTVRRMARLMKSAVDKGYTLTSAQLVPLVRDEIAEESKGVLAQMPGERIIALLGQDVMKKIRTADVARVKAAGQQKPAAIPAKPPVREPTARNPNPHLLTRDEWVKRMGGDPDSY